ncbi:MAG: MBL fold metallo-hydrolase [Verrucomicrobia bacterium]|nr:MBL fold metallo-hydrolase [Verrucomicrobiota bacterium]
MLAITFLGTGTSVGVPVILCGCPVCTSSDPRDQRYRSSIYVDTGEAAWVVDTGAEFRIQAIRARLRRVDATLYTHSHADHVMGFDDLRRFSVENGNCMPVYAARETLSELQRVFYYAFSGEARFPGYVHPEARLINGPFRLGETEIVPVRLEHGRAHVIGFVFRQGSRSLAAYLSDCKRVFEPDLELLAGVDTLILGTPCFKSLPTHMNLAEGLAFSKVVGPRATWLTHLSHDFLHAAVEKELPDNVQLAYDGLRLELG